MGILLQLEAPTRCFAAKLLAVEIDKDVEVVEEWMKTFKERWEKEHGKTSDEDQAAQKESEPVEKNPESENEQEAEKEPEHDLGQEDLVFDDPIRGPSPDPQIRDPSVPAAVHEIIDSENKNSSRSIENTTAKECRGKIQEYDAQLMPFASRRSGIHKVH